MAHLTITIFGSQSTIFFSAAQPPYLFSAEVRLDFSKLFFLSRSNDRLVGKQGAHVPLFLAAKKEKKNMMDYRPNVPIEKYSLFDACPSPPFYPPRPNVVLGKESIITQQVAIATTTTTNLKKDCVQSE